MKNGTQGFTLVELLIVIAIIGILAAVLIPNLLGARKRAYDTAALNCAKQIQAAQTAYNGDFRTYALAGANLQSDLISNCVDPVQYGTTTATDPTTAGTGDKTLTANATTFSTFVWNNNGTKVYKVTESSVQAQ